MRYAGARHAGATEAKIAAIDDESSDQAHPLGTPDGGNIGTVSNLAALLYCCHTEFMRTTLSVSRRGVVTLPAKLRRALGIKPDDQLIAETTPEGLLLRPAVTLPIEIYSEKRIREFDEAEAELEKVLRRRKQPRSAR